MSYRVFVSGTMYDLKDVHAEICEELPSMGHLPVHFNNPSAFPISPGKHSHDVCLDVVASCDVFLLVIGERYGGRYVGRDYPHFKEDEISVTHAEFRIAVEHDIPIITFVRRQIWDERIVVRKNQKDGRDIVTHHAKQVRVYDFLDEVHYRDQDNWIHQFDTSADLKLCLRQLAPLRPVRSVDKTSADSLHPMVVGEASGGVPHRTAENFALRADIRRTDNIPPIWQLPTDPIDFVGRDKLIDELAAELTHPKSNPGVVITGLHGMGGIGKTFVAIRLAHRIADKCPDGQLFIDLHGDRPEPKHPKKVMEYVIQSLEPDQRMPSDEELLTSLYRTVLRNRRVLLVLDNAVGRWQVTPLIPPSSCLLIVTSRKDFPIPGCTARQVEQLSEAEAMQLVELKCPTALSHSATIAQLCGYLPLALALAAEGLNSLTLTSEEYVQLLSDSRMRIGLADDERSVEAVIRTSYDLLDAPAQARFRKLGVFPNDFDTSATAAIWEMESGTEVIVELSRLRQMNLVRFDELKCRFSLHDLIRDFVRLLIGDELPTLYHAHAEYFSSFGRLPEPAGISFEDRATKRKVELLLERDNIEAAFEWVSEQVEDSQDAAATCCEWLLSWHEAISSLVTPEKLLLWSQIGTKAAAMCGRESKPEFWGYLGLAYYELRLLDEAIASHESQLEKARSANDEDQVGDAYWNLVNDYQRAKRTDEAVKYAELQYKFWREHSDPNKSAMGTIRLALSCAYEGNDRLRARELYKSLIENGPALWKSVAYTMLGQLAEEDEQVDEAVKYYEACFELSKSASIRRAAVIKSCTRLAEINQQRGEHVTALSYCQRLRKYHEEASEHAELAKVINCSVTMLRALGEEHEAVALYAQGIDMANAGEAWEVMSELLGQRADLHRQHGEYSEELHLCDEYISLFTKIQQKKYAAILALRKGQLLSSRHELESSAQAFNFAITMADEAEDTWTQGLAAVTLGNTHMELGRLEAALEEFNRGMGIAEENKFEYITAEAYGGIATVERRNGRLNEAVDWLIKANKTSIEVTGASWSVHGVSHGELLVLQSNYLLAIAHYEEIILDCERTNDTVGMAIGLFGRGLCEIYFGEAEESQTTLDTIDKINEQGGYDVLTTLALMLRFMIGSMRGELENAFEWARELYTGGDTYEDRSITVVRWDCMATAFRNTEMFDDSINVRKRVLARYRATNDKPSEVLACVNLAEDWLRAGAYDRANVLLQLALNSSRAFGMRFVEGYALALQGELELLHGGDDHGVSTMREGIDILRELGCKESYTRSSWRLAVQLREMGDTSSAIPLMEERVAFEENIHHVEASQHAAELSQLVLQK